MSAYILRRKFVRQFVGLDRLSTMMSWAVVVCYVFLIATSVAMGHILLQGPRSLADGVIVAALMVFVATRLRGLNNIIHECSHATFAEDRYQNVLIGKVCASITLTSFKKYKEEHLSHHAHLGDPELDRDFHDVEPLRLDEPIQSSTVIRHIVSPLIGRHLPYYLHIDFSEDDGIFFKWLRVSLVFVAIAFAAAIPVSGVLMVLVPFLFLFTALNYWADCIDHAGLISADDELLASRNVFVPRVIKWLFFPRNDSYHLVHHLFPTIPARHLQSSHEILTGDQIYSSRENAVGRFGARGVALPQVDNAMT